ncbi:MAG TPA: hypothetical protein VG738_09035 [Chitinophagaceae bacterium]|nr:hypothetical protein [Chitinophagaceae bacterium]
MKPNLITQCLVVAACAVCVSQNFIYLFIKPWLLPALLIMVSIKYHAGRVTLWRTQAVISPVAGQ